VVAVFFNGINQAKQAVLLPDYCITLLPLMFRSIVYMKQDICSREDIELLVNDFYRTVQADGLIGPVFNNVIGDHWPVHLAKMYRFWETILLGKMTYSGTPFLPHAQLPLEPDHFNRWLQLFTATIDTHFHGPVAEDAKVRAAKMATVFMSKIKYIREHPDVKPLL